MVAKTGATMAEARATAAAMAKALSIGDIGGNCIGDGDSHGCSVLVAMMVAEQ